VTGCAKVCGNLGYLEGRDSILEERYAESQPDCLPKIVAELVRLNVALFLSPGVQVTRAPMADTSDARLSYPWAGSIYQ